ncbi:MAG: hypothetical protein COA47_14830 [Robiginitomaculum sp.]|nr:MAG: hypothetical protein COA47_14830 [Robiginitomaculum sp.]
MYLRILSVLLPVTIVFMGQSAFADCDGVGCNNVKIEMLYVASGVTYLKTSGTETQLDNCVPVSGIMVSLDHSHSSADKIYALLLTAYTGKLNVNLRFNDTAGNSGACKINYAVLENN